MAVRSTRLGQASATGGGGGVTATVFTVPADRTYIVKSIRIAQTAGATVALVLMHVLLAGVTSRLVWSGNAPAIGTAGGEEGLFIVCLETDVLRLTVPAGMTLQAYVSGASLAGDPS